MPIKTFERFLDDPLYHEVIAAADGVISHGGNNFSANRHWDYGVIKDSAPVLIHNLDHASSLHKKLKESIEQKTNMRIFDNNIMIYFWTRYSYIPWHCDQGYDGALTIYLNSYWNPDFGGYFLYSEDGAKLVTVNGTTEYVDVQNIKAILPRKNLAVMQTQQVHHCTTPVNFFGDLRVTVQTFLRKDNEEGIKI